MPIVQSKLFDFLFNMHVYNKGGIVDLLRKEINDKNRLALFLGAFLEFYSAVEHFGAE